jgi:uncharacterized protein (DUF302 family)
MYVFSVELDLPFEAALGKVNQALAEEKFGVVSEINVQAVMKAKLNEDIPPYRILGACQPGLAKRVIGADSEAGALLPCNIVVQEKNGKVLVSFMDPVPVLGLAHNETISAVACDAKAHLEKVRDRLKG